jgi:hypothetical protein
MTKLWRVPGVNMELHTVETCDRPGAYPVAILPETEYPLTIRALKRIVQEHDARDGKIILFLPSDVERILETMPLADRFVPSREPVMPSIEPPTDDEIEAIHAALTGEPMHDWKGFLRKVLTRFVVMRNGAA